MLKTPLHYEGVKWKRRARLVPILFLILVSTWLIQPGEANSAAKTIVYPNGLELTGETRREYENKSIIIEGFLAISDNASLVLRDCNISLLWTVALDKPQILVENYGELELKNSNLMIWLDQIPNYSTNGRFILRNQGKLIAVNTSIQCTHDMTIRAGGTCSVSLNGLYYTGEAESSNLHWIIEDNLPESVLIGYNHDYRLAGEANSQISIDNSSIGFLGLYKDSDCSVYGSEIAQIAPYSTRETSVANSDIEILFANQFDTDFQFTGELDEHYSSWSSKIALGENINANIHLQDSGFNKLWLTLVNCTSEINDAELWLVSIYKGKASFNDSDFNILELQYGDIAVETSRVDYILGDCNDGSLVIDDCKARWVGLAGNNWDTGYHKIDAEIKDSDIETLEVNYWAHVDEVNVNISNTQLINMTMKPAPNHRVIFSESSIMDTLKLYPQQYEGDIIQITGSLDLENTKLVSYPNLFFTRGYNVRITRDGEPVTETDVKLFKNNTLWRSERTDSTGSFYLSAQWVNNTKPETPWYPLANPMNNMTDTITVTITGSNSTKEISVLSSSPVLFELNQPQEKQPYLALLITAAIVILVLMNTRNR